MWIGVSGRDWIEKGTRQVFLHIVFRIYRDVRENLGLHFDEASACSLSCFRGLVRVN
jgi:hypothetical protein